ncbi:MAG: hypothetical protein DRJ52_07725 [Thermoprotei archaeon]|nr:MAG: hypothetical protein DRJ52_07725 [Thermoprotei archaeon]RLE98004.1 MAG: hypothetical protein DRJ63_08340 [Thermoprotei archaeon]HDI75425.1 hypothetical protein [Thermoprotei archaeon]
MHELIVILPVDVDERIIAKYYKLKHILRAKVKIIVTHCLSFKEYLEYLREVYGGRGKIRYLFIDARKLPLFILDGTVIVEGEYPRLIDLVELLRYYGVKLRIRRHRGRI